MPAPAKVDKYSAYQLRTVSGLTYQQIALIQGVSKQSVQQALAEFQACLPHPDQLTSYKDARNDLLTAVEQQLVASVLSGDRLAKASLLDVGRTLKTVHGIRRLEEELSTQNVSTKMSLLISHADQHLFSQAETQADNSLPETQAVIETSSKDIKGLDGKV